MKNTFSIEALPEKWITKKIGDIFTIQQGITLSRKKDNGKVLLPFLRTSNVFWGQLELLKLDEMFFSEDQVSRLKLEKGDLLVCEGGDIGRTAIWNNEITLCCHQNHVHRLRKKDENIEPLFFMYWMQAGYKILHLYDQEGNRTTIPNLSRSRLSNFVVPVPPLPEQQKIAHVLSTIQDAKEKTEAVIAAAKELKRSLMKYLFTYGPVPVQDAPNVRLKETEIGMIPEEWEIKKIKDINIYKNKTLNPSDTPDINFEYYSIPAYQDDGNPIIESGKKIHSSKLLLSENTVLFGKLNPRVEKVWIVTNINDELTKIGSTEWLPVLPIKSVNSKYLYYLMWSNYIMDKAKTMVTGSTPSRQRVNPKSFYNIRMPVPQINEQLKIVSIFNSIDEKISSESSNYIRLELLFTSMLEQLMTGTLRVDDLDLEGVA